MLHKEERKAYNYGDTWKRHKNSKNVVGVRDCGIVVRHVDDVRVVVL